MAQSADDITIHTKRFYRVILESIDSDAETPDSFAIKLSSRVHVPLARAKLVARCLPYTAKSGLNAEQANRLKTMLEEIGGKARVEPHFVTPKDTLERAAPARIRPAGVTSPAVCPGCGAEQPAGATFCSFCLRKFRDPSSRPGSLEDLLPSENPLVSDGADTGTGWRSAVRFVRERPVPVLAALILLLIVVSLLK